MNKYQMKVINQAIEKYGAEQQLNQAVEELAELIVELAKYKRGFMNRNSIISEIADVMVCIQYISKVLAITEEEIDSMIEYKINRTKYRIESGYDVTKIERN